MKWIVMKWIVFLIIVLLLSQTDPAIVFAFLLFIIIFYTVKLTIKGLSSYTPSKQKPPAPSKSTSTGSIQDAKPNPKPEPNNKTQPQVLGPTEPTAEIEIIRGYEILPNNDLRFGIRISNTTNYMIADVEIILDHPKTLISLKGDKVRTLDNIHPNSERTVKYLLTPRECIHNEKIYAIIIYKDHAGERHTIQMRGKNINCVCPFLKEKVIHEGEFAKLTVKSEQVEEGLSISGIKPFKIADFVKRSCAYRLYTVGEHKIDDVFVLYLAGESIGDKAYYLLTAVIQPYKEKDITQIALRAYSDKSYGLHGFLNEISESIRNFVGSVQFAKEIGIVENKKVFNIIDSVIQRTSFKDIEDRTGMTSVNIEESVVQHMEINSTSKCPNCAKDVKENDEFCTNCGARLK